ncbi:hypothetical protein [uncultured Mediterranean phage uvMED]|nr:hypothetical protein [uncultured Mediterranean phage uvMED]
MNKEEKIEISEKLLIEYGYLAGLNLLSFYEIEEEYIACEIIYKAIINLNDRLNLDLPTETDLELQKDLLNKVDSISYKDDFDTHVEDFFNEFEEIIN